MRNQDLFPHQSRSLGNRRIFYLYFLSCEGKRGRTAGHGGGAQVCHFPPSRVRPLSWVPGSTALAWLTRQPPQWSPCAAAPHSPFPCSSQDQSLIPVFHPGFHPVWLRACPHQMGPCSLSDLPPSCTPPRHLSLPKVPQVPSAHPSLAPTCPLPGTSCLPWPQGSPLQSIWLFLKCPSTGRPLLGHSV